MTTKELAAVGLPADPEVQNPETAQLPEGHSSPAASGSRSHEDGEVRSDDEDVGDVDADVKDLITAKQSGPLPPSLVFGESKVTANMIRDYEAAGFFPVGNGRAPLDEQTLLTKLVKLLCSTISSPADQDFPVILFFLQFWTLSL
jgi:hypothetical protein